MVTFFHLFKSNILRILSRSALALRGCPEAIAANPRRFVEKRASFAFSSGYTQIEISQ